MPGRNFCDKQLRFSTVLRCFTSERDFYTNDYDVYKNLPVYYNLEN